MVKNRIVLSSNKFMPSVFTFSSLILSDRSLAKSLKIGILKKSAND
ncbi:MAG: hypothetical protein F6K54_40445 [Okeania sp. SIO3B5]|nr:hypothetical protein [Okeania sp. SIO3B5]NEO58759.1 hypothetical protein [Okeania sp. SIO3B5]